MNNRPKPRKIIFMLASLLLFLTMTSGSLLAQTDPEETADPYPVATEQPVTEDGYPGNVLPPTSTPSNPTPYPIFTATPVSTISTLPVVGDESVPFITPIPPEESTPDVSQSELIQSNLVLWIGFLIGLFILATGIYGAIILYTRK